MLVLSRRVGEEIVIGGQISVTITAINGDRVRVGIQAPPHVRIDRHEIHERIREFSDDFTRSSLVRAPS
jgi:carbon storage regulator